MRITYTCIIDTRIFLRNKYDFIDNGTLHIIFLVTVCITIKRPAHYELPVNSTSWVKQMNFEGHMKENIFLFKIVL